MNVEANTLVLGGGYGFEQTVLGGAHYAVAAFLPYTWLDISGNSEALGGIRIKSKRLRLRRPDAGAGDAGLEVRRMAVRLPDAGVRANGQLSSWAGWATPGLNYWTFDPIVGAAYSNAKSGLNAAAHLGYAMNTENTDTDYKSGNILHLDAAVQQILPLGSGFANIGAEAWYFQQVTCDSGAGATLGCFKGRTAGIGPVLGYIQPIGTGEADLRVQVAAGAGHQEPPERRLRLAEDGLQVLTPRCAKRRWPDHELVLTTATADQTARYPPQFHESSTGD